jgi:transmembrane sensor
MSQRPATASRIEAEASEWLVALRDRTVSLDQRMRFEAWLRADPEHVRVYQTQRAAWSAVGGMRHLLDVTAVSELELLRSAKEESGRAVRLPLPRARHFAVAAGLLAVLVGGFFLTQRLQLFGPQRQFDTTTAQLKNVKLEDGTLVTLGASSQIKVFFGKSDRRVVLTRGQAFFEVTHDTSRPFYVTAGNTLVRVVGTKFDVHYQPQAVRVAVVEGRVEVSSSPSDSLSMPGSIQHPISRDRRVTPSNLSTLEDRNGAHGSGQVEVSVLQSAEHVVLTPGEEAVTAATGHIATAKDLSAEDPGAWRRGRLVYVDAHLRDVVADINRYYDGKIELADAAVGDMQLTIAFRADQIDCVLALLESALPIQAIRTDSHRIILTTKKSVSTEGSFG